jgi:hypothetical protein
MSADDVLFALRIVDLADSLLNVVKLDNRVKRRAARATETPRATCLVVRNAAFLGERLGIVFTGENRG